MTHFEIFSAASEIHDPGERQKYLDEACNDDADLRERVETLLRSSAAVGSFLESPAPALVAVVEGPDQTQAVQPTAAGRLETHVLGDYRILREIARGGMGVVYEAEQISLGRHVALKVLPFASMLDKTQLARFKNEARAAASLDHPNVVHVHSVGSQRGVHYYAMQLIDGYTVADVIADERRRRGLDEADEKGGAPAARRSSPNSPADVLVSSGEVIGDTPSGFQAEALKDTANNTNTSGTTRNGTEEKERIRRVVELGIQATEALEHAHRMGIVHRDIKPSNLLVDAEQHLWVADFGLAMVEAEGNLSISGCMLGTLRYMSPEQMRGDRHVLDHHTDIYSLGATLYEMLTLQPAFPDTDISRLLQRIPNDEPTAPRRVNTTIPRDLETIVLKAMAKDHDGRYATASDMATDLHRFLDDKPIQASPPGTIERARKWARRHRAVVTTAVATLLLAVAVAGGLLWRERSETFSALDRETTQRKLAEQQKRIAQRQEKLAEEQKALADQRLETTRLAYGEVEQQRAIAESERRRSRLLLYISDMKLASDALQVGDVPRVASLLDRHLPRKGEEDLRGFEWHYLHKSVCIPQNWKLDMESSVWEIDISPDGLMFAVATKDGRIEVRRTSSGELLRAYATLNEINSIAWDPGGQRIASAGSDGYIRVWDVSPATTQASMPDHVRESGRLDGANSVQTTPALSFVAHEGEAFSVCFAPDRKTIVSCGYDGTIRTWEAATGRALAVLQEHQESVEQIATSPNSAMLASASSDETVGLWDLKTGSRIKTWDSPTGGSMMTVAFSPDGSHLAAGDGHGNVLVADLNSEATATVKLPDGIGSVTFLGDVRRLAAGDRGGVIHTWSVIPEEDGGLRLEPKAASQWTAHCGRVQTLANLPGTQTVLSGSRDGDAASWSPRDESSRWSCSSGEDFAIWNDGAIVVCEDEVRQFDLHERRLAATILPCSSQWQYGAAAEASSRFAVVDLFGTVAVFDLQKQVELSRWNAHHESHRIAISPDGRQVAVAWWDQREHVDLFDIASPSTPSPISARQCDCLVYSHDGRLLGVGSMDDLLLYNLVEGGPPRRLVGHDAGLKDIAFSPDGQVVATVGNDRRIKLWKVASGQEIQSMEVHRGDVRSVDFSDNGHTLATGGDHGWVRLWHTETMQPLLEIDTGSPVWKVRFAAQDRCLIVQLGNHKTLVFDASAEAPP